MTGIGHKIPVPPKRNQRGWTKLKQSVVQERISSAEVMEHCKKRRKHDLEKIVSKLEHQYPNGERKLYIQQIKNEIRELS
ncbi:MAG: hypothetical protein AB8C95_14740 [Phycisphaeraceae bacterium]